MSRDVVEAVEDAADKKTRQWLDAKRTAIATLSEERRGVYEDIRMQARKPERVVIEMPTALRLESADENGQPLPTRSKHVLSDADDSYPIDPTVLNKWERATIDQELKQLTGAPDIAALPPPASTRSASRTRRTASGSRCSSTSCSSTRPPPES